MKASNPSASTRSSLHKLSADRPSSSAATLNAGAPISQASNEWKKYCDCRLRHFATGR